MGTLVVAFYLPNLCFKQCPCSFLHIPSSFAGTHFLMHKVSESTLQSKLLHSAGPVAALPVVYSGWEYQDSDLTDWEGGNISKNDFTKMIAIGFGSLISIWLAKYRLFGGFSFLGTFIILCAVTTLGFSRLSINGTEGNIQFHRVINFLSHVQKMLQTAISVIARLPSSSKGTRGLLCRAKKGPKTTSSKEEEEDKTLLEIEDCVHKLENAIAGFEVRNRQHIKPGSLQDGNQGVGQLKEDLEALRPLQIANSHNIRKEDAIEQECIVSNNDEVHKLVKEMVLEGIQQKRAADHVPDDEVQTLHDVSENIVLSFEKNKVPSFLNPHLKPVESDAGTEEVYGVFDSMDNMNLVPLCTIPDVGTMSAIPSIPSQQYVLSIEEFRLNVDGPQSTHLSLEHMEMSSKSVHRRQHSRSVTTRASKTNGYEPDPWDKFAEGRREVAINGSIHQMAGGKRSIEDLRDLQSQNRLNFYDANSKESTGYEEKEILDSENVNTARTHIASNVSTLNGGGMNKKNDNISSLSSAEDEKVMNSQKQDSKTLQLRPALAKRNSDETNEKENSSTGKFRSDKSINIRQGKTDQNLSNLKEEEFEKLLEEGDSLLNEGEQALNGKLEAGLAELMLYKAAERYADAVSLNPSSLMAIQMWANTLLVHGQLKLKLSQNLRTMLPSNENSRPDSGSIKEINEQWEIEDVERIALREAFQEASEECEELLIEAGRKYRMALSIDRQDARPLYNWGLALCYRAQLIADEGSERAAQDADKLYMAAIDKFEAMMKIDQTYAAGALFNWGLAMRDRSRLRPIGSKERIRLMIQAKELFEDALRFDPKYGQARGAVAASIAEIEGLQKYSRGKSEEERFYNSYRNKK